jgi:ribosome-binding factor A
MVEKPATDPAKGLIRSTVGKQLGMKFTPTIEFVLDAVPETAAEMDALLKAARASDADLAPAAPEPAMPARRIRTASRRR